VVVTQPNNNVNTPSSSRQSTMSFVNNNVDSKLRMHHGAVDQLALTSRPPYEVFIVVKQTLVSMGIEIKREGDFKVRCVRRKRKATENGKPANKETTKGQKNKEKDSLVVSENNEDIIAEKKRRKYSPGPLKTLLRRTSSNNTNQLASSSSTSSSSLAYSNKSNLLTTTTNDESPALLVPMSSTKSNSSTSGNGRSPSAPNSPTFGPAMTITNSSDGTSSVNNHSNSIVTTPEILYGDSTVDSGEEIRFAVELCRIKNLPGLYIVDIKRLKGNLWGYKFLYHSLLDKLDLKGKGGYLTIGTSGGFIQ
jgi:protein-serine/threonine kinase